MAKYIIDVPDDGKCQYGYNEDTKELKFSGLRLDPNSFMGLDVTISISGATPYTEPDRKAIEDEVWQNTWKMFLTTEDFGATMGDSYSEAKAKYDAWKKEREELHVGDEVFFKGDPRKEKAIVLRLYQPKMHKPISDVLWADGSVETKVLVENLMRTDRHFDEVERLLERMRGE